VGNLDDEYPRGKSGIKNEKSEAQIVYLRGSRERHQNLTHQMHFQKESPHQSSTKTFAQEFHDKGFSKSICGYPQKSLGFRVIGKKEWTWRGGVPSFNLPKERPATGEANQERSTVLIRRAITIKKRRNTEKRRKGFVGIRPCHMPKKEGGAYDRKMSIPIICQKEEKKKHRKERP